MDASTSRSLPDHVLEDILNRVPDARDVARAQAACKDLRRAGNQVTSLRFIVSDDYHESARSIDMASLGSSIPGTSTKRKLPFKEDLVRILKQKCSLVQLRLEVEPTLQAKSVGEDEKRRTDFWISDPHFVRKWIFSALEHLCIIDYGQQAIMRRSTIVKILSETCKGLKTLDLRNMFLETSGCSAMPSMRSLTWRCVKVRGGALQDINDAMPKLQTLALLGVFGVEKGRVTFPDMKVLCLGLSTPSKEIEMNLPNLEKLQLKMQTPESLIINASLLKYVAFNLEVMHPSRVELNSLPGRLQELLYCAASFVTLSNLVDQHTNLSKLFLDIPCMALGEDGRFLGVIQELELTLPSFPKLHQCEALKVLNVGPGLWHSMETSVQKLAAVEKWPSMTRLILHMIPHCQENAIKVLQMLLRPSVTSVTIYVHTSSPVTLEVLKPIVEDVVSHVEVTFFSWTKSLDFSCFSF